MQYTVIKKKKKIMTLKYKKYITIQQHKQINYE